MWPLLILIPVFCLGHAAFWAATFNLFHSFSLAQRMVKRSEKVVLLIAAVIPFAVLWAVLSRDRPTSPPDDVLSTLIAAYLVVCLVAAVIWTFQWCRRTLFSPTTKHLICNDTERHDVAAAIGERPVTGFTPRLLDRLPINEMLTLTVTDKRLWLPQLPPGLEGLRIAHVSDLHYAGHIGRSYFDYVMDRVEELTPDVIVLTGDVVDKDKCMPWVEATLGRLHGPHGKFFVLGNHDRRVDNVQRLRDELAAAGFADCAGQWRRVDIKGSSMFLAGNELPWFDNASGPFPDEWQDEPGQGLRVLLAHTPDQFHWARSREFDLMLAGHTHGGQIRLPLAGPVIAPSRYGVRYASGVFFEPPTLMHVSRGISGMQSIRWNCPPELALLTLTANREPSAT